ncbi:MAG: YcgN family cysteine cluster protein [Hyphomicrobiaceae bacterium]
MSEPFWRHKRLDDMTSKEWESLCDGCGQCCLLKLEDEDDGTIYLTKLSCSMLDLNTCRCSDYSRRHTLMPDCVSITPEKVRSLSWLPATCAYRLVDEGKDLAWWHPLISGDRNTVHQAGISVRGEAHKEDEVDEDDYGHYIIGEVKE